MNIIRSIGEFIASRLRASDAAIEAYLNSLERHPMADAPRDGSVIHVDANFGRNGPWVPIQFSAKTKDWRVTFAQDHPLVWDEIKDNKYRVFPASDKEQVKS